MITRVDNPNIDQRATKIQSCEMVAYLIRSWAATYRIVVLLTVGTLVLNQCSAAVESDSETAYIRDITKRADRVVASLAIDNEAAKTRVRELIVSQYRNLRDIHADRDSRIGQAKKVNSADPAVTQAWVETARNAANRKLADVHRRFLARLSVELSPEQVDKVKDGMTYGVVNITYKRYLELFPQLTDEQKREVLANLVEAREYAMDGGSSEEKHAVFGKYKGRINNYLSAAGDDLKQAEKTLAAKQKNQ
jgi:Protein of unknown function (DUF3826)